MPKLNKIFPVIISWGIFLLVIFTVSYPDSLTQASFFQLLIFFGSFFISITLTLNLFLKNFVTSLTITFGIIFLLLLKGLNALNIVTAAITVIAIILITGSFRKNTGSNLTSHSNIPKLKNLLRRK
ncbi:MAG: hypothetical protein Q7R49_01050 [Candidatus Daviesbacteria bacterium]|nr:hypothetical protein [Candidatus Daviesbacteria bacterium]